MKIRELYLKNEYRSCHLGHENETDSTIKTNSMRVWSAPSEIDHLIVEDHRAVYKVSWNSGENGSSMPWIETIEKKEESTRPEEKQEEGSYEYRRCMAGRPLTWKIDTNKAFCKQECECEKEEDSAMTKTIRDFLKIKDSCPLTYRNVLRDILHPIVAFRCKKENPKKKEFTYNEEWNWRPHVEFKLAGIKVCDKVFDIKKGMCRFDVRELSKEILSYIGNEFEDIPAYIVDIMDKDVELRDGGDGKKEIITKYFITDNMDPKDILDIMMKVCERVEKYIKEGK